MEEKLLSAFCQPSGILIRPCDLVAVFCDVMHLLCCAPVFDLASSEKASEPHTFILRLPDVESLDLCRLPSLLLAQGEKNAFWAQKGPARLSAAEVRGNGASPNSKQASLQPQKHTGATGINMQ